jgi:hypothetical protein
VQAHRELDDDHFARIDPPPADHAVLCPP